MEDKLYFDSHWHFNIPRFPCCFDPILGHKVHIVKGRGNRQLLGSFHEIHAVLFCAIFDILHISFLLPQDSKTCHTPRSCAQEHHHHLCHCRVAASYSYISVAICEGRLLPHNFCRVARTTSALCQHECTSSGTFHDKDASPGPSAPQLAEHCTFSAYVHPVT